MSKLPVLLVAFSKKEQTKTVLAAIEAYRPSKVYIAQDGARIGQSGEAERVAEVRQLLESLSFPCEVHYRFQKRNKGVQVHVEEAITWFFEKEEAGIILEDDTVPTPDFFRYCEDLIVRYREDKRVMMIGGCNLNLVSEYRYSYFFSTHPLIWGWATWRDRWAKYDASMRTIEQMDGDGSLSLVYADPFRRETERKRIQDLKQGHSTAWDYRWAYTMLAHNGLCAVPAQNLVVNIGFGEGATNTVDLSHPSAALRTEPLRGPIEHPPFMARCVEWENRFFYPNQHFHRYFSLKEMVLGLGRKISEKMSDISLIWSKPAKSYVPQISAPAKEQRLEPRLEPLLSEPRLTQQVAA